MAQTLPTETEIRESHFEKRLTTLVTYWLTQVENPARDPEMFKPVLADAFDFDFGNGSITSYDGLAAWVKGPASSVSASRHVMTAFSYKSLGDNLYEIDVSFDWFGIRPDDVWVKAKTRHVWTTEAALSEGLPRLVKIRVETVEPFAVIER